MSSPSARLAEAAGRLRGTIAVNSAAQAIALDVAAVCKSSAVTSMSPIDEYMEHCKEIVVEASDAATADDVRRVLLVELISSAEWYFRRIIAGCVSVCSLTQGLVAKRQVPMGALKYHELDSVAYAIFEHTALSGGGELARTTSGVLGIDIKPNSSPASAIAEFDRVCNLRHAVVHARGRLGVVNLTELKLPLRKGVLVVQISIPAFHDAMAACHSAVRAYNQYVFDAMLDRWIKGGELTGDWTQDGPKFSALMDLFSSISDLGSRPDTRKMHAELSAFL